MSHRRRAIYIIGGGLTIAVFLISFSARTSTTYATDVADTQCGQGLYSCNYPDHQDSQSCMLNKPCQETPPGCATAVVGKCVAQNKCQATQACGQPLKSGSATIDDQGGVSDTGSQTSSGSTDSSVSPTTPATTPSSGSGSTIETGGASPAGDTQTPSAPASADTGCGAYCNGGTAGPATPSTPAQSPASVFGSLSPSQSPGNTSPIYGNQTELTAQPYQLVPGAMQSIPNSPTVNPLQTSGDTFSGGSTAGGQTIGADGLPISAPATQPSTGFWSSAANTVSSAAQTAVGAVGNFASSVTNAVSNYFSGGSSGGSELGSSGGSYSFTEDTGAYGTLSAPDTSASPNLISTSLDNTSLLQPGVVPSQAGVNPVGTDLPQALYDQSGTPSAPTPESYTSALLGDKVSSLSDEVSQNQSQIQALQDTIANPASPYAATTLTNQMADLYSQINATDDAAQKAALTAQYNSLQTQLSQLNPSANQDANQIQNQIDGLQQRNLYLNGQLDQVNNTIGDLNSGQLTPSEQTLVQQVAAGQGGASQGMQNLSGAFSDQSAADFSAAKSAFTSPSLSSIAALPMNTLNGLGNGFLGGAVSQLQTLGQATGLLGQTPSEVVSGYADPTAAHVATLGAGAGIALDALPFAGPEAEVAAGVERAATAGETFTDAGQAIADRGLGASPIISEAPSGEVAVADAGQSSQIFAPGGGAGDAGVVADAGTGATGEAATAPVGENVPISSPESAAATPANDAGSQAALAQETPPLPEVAQPEPVVASNPDTSLTPTQINQAGTDAVRNELFGPPGISADNPMANLNRWSGSDLPANPASEWNPINSISEPSSEGVVDRVVAQETPSLPAVESPSPVVAENSAPEIIVKSGEPILNTAPQVDIGKAVDQAISDAQSGRNGAAPSISASAADQPVILFTPLTSWTGSKYVAGGIVAGALTLAVWTQVPTVPAVDAQSTEIQTIPENQLPKDAQITPPTPTPTPTSQPNTPESIKTATDQLTPPLPDVPKPASSAPQDTAKDSDTKIAPTAAKASAPTPPTATPSPSPSAPASPSAAQPPASTAPAATPPALKSPTAIPAPIQPLPQPVLVQAPKPYEAPTAQTNNGPSSPESAAASPSANSPTSIANATAQQTPQLPDVAQSAPKSSETLPPVTTQGTSYPFIPSITATLVTAAYNAGRAIGDIGQLNNDPVAIAKYLLSPPPVPAQSAPSPAATKTPTPPAQTSEPASAPLPPVKPASLGGAGGSPSKTAAPNPVKAAQDPKINQIQKAIAGLQKQLASATNPTNVYDLVSKVNAGLDALAKNQSSTPEEAQADKRTEDTGRAAGAELAKIADAAGNAAAGELKKLDGQLNKLGTEYTQTAAKVKNSFAGSWTGAYFGGALTQLIADRDAAVKDGKAIVQELSNGSLTQQAQAAKGKITQKINDLKQQLKTLTGKATTIVDDGTGNTPVPAKAGDKTDIGDGGTGTEKAQTAAPKPFVPVRGLPNAKPASGQALANAVNSACKAVGCNAPVMQQALGGVCAIESHCNAGVSHIGFQYQGLFQVGTNETKAAINQIRKIAQSSNLSPAEQAEANAAADAAQAVLNSGRNPNADPVLGAWIGVGYHLSNGTLPKVSAATSDPKLAAAYLEIAQMAPDTFKGNFSPNTLMSWQGANNLARNGYFVQYGFTAAQAAQAVAAHVGANIPNGVAFASQFTPGGSPAAYAPATPLTSKDVTIVGDSIGQGTSGCASGVGTACSGKTFGGSAVSGATIAAMVSQINALPNGSKVAIIAGTNDYANSSAKVQADVKALLAAAAAKNITIVAWAGASANLGNATQNAQFTNVNNAIKGALPSSIPFINLQDSSLDAYRAGYHFSPAGYNAIGQMILAAANANAGVAPRSAPAGGWNGSSATPSIAAGKQGYAPGINRVASAPSSGSSYYDPQTGARGVPSDSNMSQADFTQTAREDVAMERLAQTGQLPAGAHYANFNTVANADGTYDIVDANGKVLAHNIALQAGPSNSDGTIRLLADKDGNPLGLDGKALADGGSPLSVSSDATLPKATVDSKGVLTFTDNRPVQPKVNPNPAPQPVPKTPIVLPPRTTTSPVPPSHIYSTPGLGSQPGQSTPAPLPSPVVSPLLTPSLSCLPSTVTGTSTPITVRWSCLSGTPIASGFSTSGLTSGQTSFPTPYNVSGSQQSTLPFSLFCVSGAQRSPAAMCYVTVKPGATTTSALPVAAIIANPSSIASGAASKLSWTSQNATTCTVTTPAGLQIGSQSTSSTATTPALTTTTLFTETCMGVSSTTVIATTTVTVH